MVGHPYAIAGWICAGFSALFGGVYDMSIVILVWITRQLLELTVFSSDDATGTGIMVLS